MNVLKVHTLCCHDAHAFQVLWTNSLIRVGGTLDVRVMPDMPDKQIAAELAALQHLLEVKQVLGRNVVGSSGIQLTVSFGAIRKLQRRQSGKVHLAPYASFLTTRFAGCDLRVDKDTSWFKDFEPKSVEHLVVGKPRGETIQLAGLGRVAVTSHVLERLTTRLLPDTSPQKPAHSVWKKLQEVASDSSVREVSRQSLWAGVMHGRQGRREGRYFLNEKENLVLVVTDNPREGKRLVTAYPANHQFRRRQVPV